MASRETRRIIEKKSDKDEKNPVERNMQRRPLLYAFSVILFVLITVSFIGSGIFSAGSYQKTAKIPFGKYAGKEISWMNIQGNYFKDQQEAAASQLQQQNPQGVETDAQIKQVWRTAFDETVKHEAMLYEARKNGYHVSTKMVEEQLLNYPYYLDEMGRFSETQYNDMEKISRDNIEISYSEGLLKQLYREDHVLLNLYSNKEVEFYINMYKNQRAVKVVEFLFSDYPDQKVADFGKSNINDFKRMSLSRIVFTNSNKATVDQVLQMFNSGQRSFEDLAKDYSKDIYNTDGGNMGVQYYYQVRNFFESENKEKFTEEIFKLKQGQVSSAFQEKERFVIFRANADAVEPKLDDPETLKGIREYILKYKKGEISDYITTLAKNFKTAAEANGFDKAALAAKLPVTESEYFPINYLTLFNFTSLMAKGTDTSKLSALASNKIFFSTAFSLKDKQVSDPITLDDKIMIMTLVGTKTLTDDEVKSYNQNYASFAQYYQLGDMVSLADEYKYPYSFYLTNYLNFEEDFNSQLLKTKTLFKDEFEKSYKKYLAQPLSVPKATQQPNAAPLPAPAPAPSAG